MDDVLDWQQRFFAQPKVYVLIDREGVIEGVYESAEAARFAEEWHEKHARKYRLRVHEMPVCSLQLSKERWT